MKTKQFRIGRLATFGQVIKALGKTIRAMSDGSLDSQVGARICNGLGIMRACFETQKLEQLESRMDEIADRVARDRTNAARERTSTDEAWPPRASANAFELRSRAAKWSGYSSREARDSPRSDSRSAANSTAPGAFRRSIRPKSPPRADAQDKPRFRPARRCIRAHAFR
jgi:hypothetical protein